MASPKKLAAAANVSRWPLAIRPQSTSGFSDQSRWARARRAGSERSIRSRPTTTPRKMIAFHSFSQKMIRAGEVPPSSAAARCSTVASGPYRDPWRRHIWVARSPMGSPVRASWLGVITYGLWSSTAIRPKVA